MPSNENPSNQDCDNERGQLFTRIGTLEKTIVEQAVRIETHERDLVNCWNRCNAWQTSWKEDFVDFRKELRADMMDIMNQLQSRLPKWATVGGIVLFSLMSGTLGWLAKG